ncbi:hypothetical protein V5O48_013370, partial [Marasmius crinis-equi]
MASSATESGTPLYTAPGSNDGHSYEDEISPSPNRVKTTHVRAKAIAKRYGKLEVHPSFEPPLIPLQDSHLRTLTYSEKFWNMHLDPVYVQSYSAWALLTIQLNLNAGIVAYFAEETGFRYLESLFEQIVSFDISDRFYYPYNSCRYPPPSWVLHCCKRRLVNSPPALILTFRAQYRRPILHGLARSFVLASFYKHLRLAEGFDTAWKNRHDQEHMQLRNAYATIFKVTTVNISKELISELAERCGAQGLLACNQVILGETTFKGGSIAKGDSLVISI